MICTTNLVLLTQVVAQSGLRRYYRRPKGKE
jgi:hypothetical protein